MRTAIYSWISNHFRFQSKCLRQTSPNGPVTNSNNSNSPGCGSQIRGVEFDGLTSETGVTPSELLGVLSGSSGATGIISEGGSPTDLCSGSCWWSLWAIASWGGSNNRETAARLKMILLLLCQFINCTYTVDRLKYNDSPQIRKLGWNPDLGAKAELDCAPGHLQMWRTHPQPQDHVECSLKIL